MSFEMSALILAWLAIVVIAFAISGLIRQQREIIGVVRNLARLYPTPDPGPEWIGPAMELSSSDIGLDGVGWRDFNILLFLSRDCGVCERRFDEALDIAAENSSWLIVALYTGESDPRIEEKSAVLDINGVSTQRSISIVSKQPTLFETFRVSATPFAAALNSEGRVIATRQAGRDGSLREFVDLLRSDNMVRIGFEEQDEDEHV